MGKPIRILCVFKSLDRGGAETMCMNLYRNIDRTRIQFDFVKHTNKECEYDDEIRSLGGCIYIAPTFFEYNKKSYEKWWENHFANHPEHRIIHGHYYTISDVYFRVAHQFGRKTIAHSHNAIKMYADDKKNFYDIFENRIIEKHHDEIEKHADYCFACSNEAGDYLFSKEFRVIKNAIDVKQFTFNKEIREKKRKELQLENNYIVGIVARITQQKNPYGVIDIFDEIYKLKSNAVLLWIGDNFMGKSIVNYAKKKGVLDRIIFTGSVGDVYKYYQAMDVFILPSYYEGLVIAGVEAQAAGLPFYISDRVSDEICITELCHKMPLDNPKLWANTIVNNNNERKAYVQEFYDAGYDISQTSRKISDLYLEIDNNICDGSITTKPSVVLLMTGTIDASAYKKIRSFIVVKDTELRLSQYQKAIEFYIENSPFTDIIFIENSGFNFDYKKYEKLAEEHNKYFEFISGEIHADKVNTYGRSWGEAYLIQEAVEKSKLIAKSQEFYKVTGRILLKNASSIVEKTKTYRNAFIYNPIYRLFYTHFFKMNVEDFQKHYMNLYEECNDREHNTIEKVYYNNYKKKQMNMNCQGGVPIRPIFEGEIGLNQQPYSKDGIRRWMEIVGYRSGFFNPNSVFNKMIEKNNKK